VTRRQELGALAALVLVTTGLRAWAAVDVPGPWIAPDEMVYGLLGRSLYLHGSLAVVGGATPFYSLLTPALAGLPPRVFGPATGHDVLQGLQALVMSLAAVPVYLWGRSLVPPRAALIAAALTLSVPGLAYAGLVMTEVLFYPLLVLAAWAIAESIARPSARVHALLVVAVTAAVATRLQALVLLPVFVTAAFVDAGLARSWANLRRLVPAAAGLGAAVVGWIAWRLASGSGPLGGYEVVATSSYGVADAARFVLYHAAALLILCGLFPAAAVALMTVRAARHGEPDPRVRAYIAVASSLSVWLVVQVGVFASRYSDRIVERTLFGVAPVLFLGLVLWLERGERGTYLGRAAIGAVAAAVLLVLPVKRYVNIYGTHDAMTLIPLYKLLQASSPGTLVAVYSAVAGAASIAFALLPRGALRAVPAVLLVAFVATSVVSSRFVAEQARAQQDMFLGGNPRWIDRNADGNIVYLYDGDPNWNRVWETLFWNSRVNRVYDLAGNVPGPLPQSPAEVQPDGTLLLPPSAKAPGGFALTLSAIQVVGERVAEDAGLELWRIDPPLRVSTWTTGLQGGGDIYAHTQGRLTAYGCTRGVFRLTLVIKEPQEIELRVNGQLTRTLRFPSPAPNTVWRGVLPATGAGAACTLEVAPSGLLGTTVFEFDRG
jgi:hypothetical protein